MSSRRTVTHARPRRARTASVGIAWVALAALALTGCAPEPAGDPAPTLPPAPTSASAPTTPAPPSPEELRLAHATEIVDAESTAQRAASIMMASTPSADPATVGSFAEAHGLGGFLLMGANVPADAAALSTVTAALSPDPVLPRLIGIDEEGGDVTRLPWDTLPGADTLKFAAPDDVRAAAAGRAALLAESGVTVNFGIVADVTADPSSFIFSRTLGATGDDAAPRVAAAVSGEHGTVLSTLKHFPGHGAAAGDSHSSIPTTDLTRADWTANESVPFAAGIDAGAELLMFGHLAYTAVDAAPASLSSEWHRIAREDLGFTGVTVTDDLGMLLNSGDPAYADPSANAVQSVLAGNDLLVLVAGADETTVAASISGITAAVDAGTLPPERLREAAIRVTDLRLALAE